MDRETGLRLSAKVVVHIVKERLQLPCGGGGMGCTSNRRSSPRSRRIALFILGNDLTRIGLVFQYI